MYLENAKYYLHGYFKYYRILSRKKSPYLISQNNNIWHAVYHSFHFSSGKFPSSLSLVITKLIYISLLLVMQDWKIIITYSKLPPSLHILLFELHRLAASQHVFALSNASCKGNRAFLTALTSLICLLPGMPLLRHSTCPLAAAFCLIWNAYPYNQKSKSERPQGETWLMLHH